MANVDDSCQTEQFELGMHILPHVNPRASAASAVDYDDQRDKVDFPSV